MRCTLAITVVASVGTLSHAAVTLVPDRREWTRVSGITQQVPTTAGGLTYAAQIVLPPEADAPLGCHLDFGDCLTETAHFSITGLDASSTFVFSESDTLPEVFADALSIGPIGAFTDDDMRFDFPGTTGGGEAVFAFGFTVRDNEFAPGESITLFGIGDVALGSFPLPHCPGSSAFVGLTSDDPIAWILIDESPDPDDIAVGDFEVGSQLPPDIHYGLPELDWEIHVGSFETLHMHADDVALAVELGGGMQGEPAPDAPLGPTLTFEIGAPLSRSFQLTAMEGGGAWVLDDADASGKVGPGFEEALSVGERGAQTHDTWQLQILDGPPVNAIAFFLGDSDDGDGECIEIYGVRGTLFATITPMPSGPGGKSFIGVHAHDKDESIGSIVFHECPDSDDISISELRLAPAGKIVACPGDVDHDGHVDGVDLGLLLAVWGPCEDCHHEDLNEDGVVDASDLADLLAAWGHCPK